MTCLERKPKGWRLGFATPPPENAKDSCKEIDDPRIRGCLDGKLQAVSYKVSKSRFIALYLPSRMIWESPYSPVGMGNGLTDYDNKPNISSCRLEGVVDIQPEYIDKRDKVYVEVIGRYVFESDEPDSIDINVHRYVYKYCRRLYPIDRKFIETPLSCYCYPVRELKRKLGANAFVFCADMNNTPDSLWLHSKNKALPRPNAIRWEVRTYINDTNFFQPYDEKAVVDKGNMARLKIRKLTFIDDFIIQARLCDKVKSSKIRRYAVNHRFDGGGIQLDVGLTKAIYLHDETVNIAVICHNFSDRVVKKINVAIYQRVKFHLFVEKEHWLLLDEDNFRDDHLHMPILPGIDGWFSKKILFPFKPVTLDKLQENMALTPPLNHKLPLNCNSLLLATSTQTRQDLNNLTNSFNGTSSLTAKVLMSEAYKEHRKQFSQTLIMNLEHPITVSYHLIVEAHVTQGPGLLGIFPKVEMELTLAHDGPYDESPLPIDVKLKKS